MYAHQRCFTVVRAEEQKQLDNASNKSQKFWFWSIRIAVIFIFLVVLVRYSIFLDVSSSARSSWDRAIHCASWYKFPTCIHYCLGRQYNMYKRQAEKKTMFNILFQLVRRRTESEGVSSTGDHRWLSPHLCICCSPQAICASHTGVIVSSLDLSIFELLLTRTMSAYALPFCSAAQWAQQACPIAKEWVWWEGAGAIYIFFEWRDFHASPSALFFALQTFQSVDS